LKASAKRLLCYSNLFNWCPRQTISSLLFQNAGLDPDDFPSADKSAMNFGFGGNTDSKAGKDIWGSGQGIGLIEDAPTVESLVERIRAEFSEATSEFNNKAKIS
jgi:Dioxygenases related to 2-nitropropane dioxygenase